MNEQVEWEMTTKEQTSINKKNIELTKQILKIELQHFTNSVSSKLKYSEYEKNKPKPFIFTFYLISKLNYLSF